MMKLKRFGQGVWYDFPGVVGVRLKIKSLSRKDMLDIRSHSKRKMAVQDAERVVDDWDEGAFMWGVFHSCLEGWEGISMDEGLTLTRDEMVLAIFDNDALREFVFDKSSKSYKQEEAVMEGELKNSESSQGGS